MFSSRKLVISAISVLIGLAAIDGALAQDGAPAILDEIIVTAQKREQSLQELPLSVAVLTAEDLQRAGTTNLTDLRVLVPGLSIDDTDLPQIALRGITSNNLLPTGDPAVATHYNGVYIGRPSALRGAFFDLARVEVLKGPQGILYGRNATGGSINIIYNRPEFDTNGIIDTQVGNYSYLSASGAANLEAVEDTLAFRASATYQQRDSFADTGTVSNEHYGSALDDRAIRLQTLYNANENLSFLLGYNTYESDGGVSAVRPIPMPAGADPFVSSLNTEPFWSDEQDTAWLEANYETERTQFTYLGSWFDFRTFFVFDFDGTDFLRQEGTQEMTGEQWSHELRLNSVGGGNVDWLLGLYYFDEQTTRIASVDLGPIALNIGIPDFNSTSMAAFGKLSFNVSDNFRIGAGLRYSDDEKAENNSTRQGIAFGMSIPLTVASGSGNWDSTDWELTLEFDADDDNLLYGKVGTGYKAGGFVDAISTVLTGTMDPQFDNEDIFAVEVGHKSEFMSNRLRMYSAFYWYDYTDQQVVVFFGGGNIVENADSNISGFETEIEMAISDRSQMYFSFAYNDSEYDSGNTLVDTTAPGGPASVDVGGNRIPLTPEMAFNIGYQHSFSLGNGASLTPSIHFHWEDDNDLRHFGHDLDVQDAWSETDARVSYRPASDNWYLDAWVSNIENRDGINVVDQSYLTSSTGGRSSNFRGPRTYGASFGYRFE